MSNGIDYTKTCFVIMPFGKKPVGERTVDFNAIYDGIFEPAIRATMLPEGGNLEPRRTDKDFFVGDISQEMFQYLEYSRFALADITGLNADVFFELGVRHRARETGTAIFRQLRAPLPFDINQIKAFDYEYEPEASAEQSRELITRVLTESLQQNRIDSPVQRALLVQRERRQDTQPLLQEAENAIRHQDVPTAVAKYYEAVQADANNPLLRVKLGLLLKTQDRLSEALEQFTLAVASDPRYAEAHREKGIVENRIYRSASATVGVPDGENSLRRAVELNPNDFDALASLGGVLRRQKPPRYEEAYQMYERSAEVSQGHPYPLLNALKLQARAERRLPIDSRRKALLQRGERVRRAQAMTEPPYDAPWCLFDLAEIRLYNNDQEGFLRYLDEGLAYCDLAWQPKTFRDSLQLLVDGGITLPGLDEGKRRRYQIFQSLRAEECRLKLNQSPEWALRAIPRMPAQVNHLAEARVLLAAAAPLLGDTSRKCATSPGMRGRTRIIACARTCSTRIWSAAHSAIRAALPSSDAMTSSPSCNSRSKSRGGCRSSCTASDGSANLRY